MWCVRIWTVAVLLASVAAWADDGTAPVAPPVAQPSLPPVQMVVLAELLRDAQNREGLALMRAVVAERRAAACAPAAPVEK